MIDISDGLLQDLGHLAKASGIGAEIEVDALPFSPALRQLLQTEALGLALHGGDDYELLFTAAQSSRGEIEALGADLGIPLTRVGVIQPGDKLVLLDASGAPMACDGGYDHFAS